MKEKIISRILLVSAILSMIATPVLGETVKLGLN